MSLSPGSRLGPYEIMDLIGAGGMGEVWKARDTRLDRIVAVKVLQERFSERFDREAHAIAALNHPHICTLHDVGPDYLVMEYVEGKPLRGPLPLKEVLRVAIQIVDALDAAHRHGIVHRDLKPDNILLTRSGVKLLDFGLARQVLCAAAAGEGTATVTLTQQGTILGTPQYMSPEQVAGKEADARSDIFSFGAILYELITGKRAFEGRGAAGVMAAVMNQEPEPDPRLTGPLEPVVRRCLAKNPEQRWHSTADLIWALENLRESTAPAVSTIQPRLWIAATAVLACLATFSTVILWRQPAANGLLARVSIGPPAGKQFSEVSYATISPDSRLLVFVAESEGTRSLWLRPIDSLEARQLPGTEESWAPFWSPDSKSIGFFTPRALNRIEVSGGTPQIIANAAFGRGGAWSLAGVIVFGSQAGGLQRVAASGGAPAALTATSSQEASHRYPQFLPDGNRFLYWSSDGNIFASSLDRPNERTWIMSSQAQAVYTPATAGGSGQLLWIRNETLVTQRFDVNLLRLKGEPTPVGQHVRLLPRFTGLTSFSASTHVVVYGTTAALMRQMVWMGRDGKKIAAVGPAGEYTSPHLSPDGRSVVLSRSILANQDIWRFDFNRQVMTRLTFDAGGERSPVWSPDGSSVAFTAYGPGGSRLLRRYASGGGDAKDELLHTTRVGDTSTELVSVLTDWSSDGKYLLYTGIHPETGHNLRLLPVEVERKSVPLLQTQFNEFQGQFSPDGKWVVYTSDETGRHEVYARPSSPVGTRWQISSQGGSQPRWRGDGKELYYRGPEGRLMVAKVVAGGEGLKTLSVHDLFQTPLRPHLNEYDYDVTSDGQRFLVLLPAEDGDQVSLKSVINWQSALKR